MRKVWCLNISRDKKRLWQLRCQTLGNRCECQGSSEMAILTDEQCHSKCGTPQNHHCSMAISAAHKSNCAALQRSFHMNELFSGGTPNKQSFHNQHIELCKDRIDAWCVGKNTVFGSGTPFFHRDNWLIESIYLNVPFGNISFVWRHR